MKAKPLTEPQRRALRSARDHGSPGYHLSGRSSFGGFTATRRFLRNAGLIEQDGKITEAGRTALERS